MLPGQAWKKISAGAGAKGPRVYHWARAAIRPLQDTASYWLLVRRSLTDPTDLAYYLCYGPEHTPLRELVRVAGARWAIEETFQTAKGQVGLDQYQVRRYDSWYRHITLAMLAHAFLTVTTAHASQEGDQKGGARQRRRPHPTDPARGPRPARPPHLEPATRPNIGAELVTLATPPPSPRPTLSLHSPRSPTISAAGSIGGRTEARHWLHWAGLGPTEIWRRLGLRSQTWPTRATYRPGHGSIPVSPGCTGSATPTAG